MGSTVLGISLAIFALCALLVQGADRILKPEHVVSFKVDGRIVNGTRAVAGQFPHVVSLKRRWTNSLFCGGSILNEKWIVTAAHCMFRFGQQIEPGTFYIVAGAIRLDDEKVFPAQIRQIEELFVHPKYNENYLLNDIALLMLQTGLNTRSPHVQAIRLNTVTPPTGTECIVSGFGYLKEGGPVSNELMYVNLPLLSQPTCKRLLGHLTLMKKGQICAGYVEGNKDACQGDSGGPFMCKGVLAGIVSGGEGCARPNLPGFYTEIAHYRTWINDIQNSNGSCCQCSCKEKQAGNGASSTLTSASIISVMFICLLKSLLV